MVLAGLVPAIHVLQPGTLVGRDSRHGHCAFPTKIPSRCAVNRNGQRKFRKDFSVKGAKRRLWRSKTLDRKIFSKHGQPLRSTAFSDRQDYQLAGSPGDSIT